jgi:hypothetical protein
MKKPRQPMCESCTSTLRKHYTGKTNSPELVAAFVHEVEWYKCKGCGAANAGATAVAASNLTCRACGWVAGSKKKKNPKGKPNGAEKVAASSNIAKMLGGSATGKPASHQMLPANLMAPPPPLPDKPPPVPTEITEAGALEAELAWTRSQNAVLMRELSREKSLNTIIREDVLSSASSGLGAQSVSSCARGNVKGP